MNEQARPFSARHVWRSAQFCIVMVGLYLSATISALIGAPAPLVIGLLVAGLLVMGVQAWRMLHVLTRTR